MAETLMTLADTTDRVFGMEPMLPFFQSLPCADALFKLPFPRYSLVALQRPHEPYLLDYAGPLHKFAPLAGMICGTTLMLWIGILQFYIFPFNLMSAAYFIFGAAETTTAYLLYRRQKREIR